MDIKQVLSLLHTCLYQNLIALLIDLTDTQLEYSASQIDTRSIRDVAIHAYRPVLAVACLLIEEGWPSRPELPTTKDGLLQLLHIMHKQINTNIANLTPDQLDQSISLPWKQQQHGVDALIEGCAHGLLHVGTIQGIRAFGGFPAPPEIPMPPRS